MYNIDIKKLYKYYNNNLTLYSFLFHSISTAIAFFSFLTVLAISAVTLSIIPIKGINKNNFIYILFSILLYIVFLLIIKYSTNKAFENVILEYKEKFCSDDIPDRYECLRLLKIEKFKECYEKILLSDDGKNTIEIIIKSLYKNSEEAKYEKIGIIGIVSVLLLPIWQNIVNKLMSDSTTFDETLKSTILIVAISIPIIIVILILRLFWNNVILDILNTKSNKYKAIASFIEDNILPELVKTSVSEKQLKDSVNKINDILVQILNEVKYIPISNTIYNIKTSTDIVNSIYENIQDYMC